MPLAHTPYRPAARESRLIPHGCALAPATGTHRLWDGRKKTLLLIAVRHALVANGCSANDVFEAFSQFDHDGSGEVDFSEFRMAMLELLELPMSVASLRQLWVGLDQDNSGSINAKEFCTVCFPEIDEDGITLIAPLKAEAAHAAEGREAALEKRVTAIEQVLERQAAALEQQALLLRDIHDSVVVPESLELGKLRV